MDAVVRVKFVVGVLVDKSIVALKFFEIRRNEWPCIDAYATLITRAVADPWGGFRGFKPPPLSHKTMWEFLTIIAMFT